MIQNISNNRRCVWAAYAYMVVQENPNEQESTTASLHYCEMATAIGVLQPGGSLVIKAFTLFEHSSLCHLWLLGALFDSVAVFKPATSKPGNSETYIIGKGFRGISDDWLQHIQSYAGRNLFETRAMLSMEKLPEAFLESAVACAIHFANRQREVSNLQTIRICFLFCFLNLIESQMGFFVLKETNDHLDKCNIFNKSASMHRYCT